MTATAPDSWSDSDRKAICEQLDRIVKSGPFVQSRRLLRASGIEVSPQRSCCERELQDDRFWHKADMLGLTVLTPDNRRRVVRAAALTGTVPPPFLTEPSGLSGVDGKQRGTRMHHKFVVLDFDKPTARVYLGSYNFSEPADGENGENLVLVRDRTVATSYMIEALRIYDHYVFRVASEEGQGAGHPLELKLPPQPGGKAWFERDWTDAVRARDRLLFARAD